MYICGAIVSVITILSVGYIAIKKGHKCYTNRSTYMLGFRSRTACCVCPSSCCNHPEYHSVSPSDDPQIEHAGNELSVEETAGPGAECQKEKTTTPLLERQDSGIESAESSLQSTESGLLSDNRSSEPEPEVSTSGPGVKMSSEEQNPSVSDSYACPSVGFQVNQDVECLKARRNFLAYLPESKIPSISVTLLSLASLFL